GSRSASCSTGRWSFTRRAPPRACPASSNTPTGCASTSATIRGSQRQERWRVVRERGVVVAHVFHRDGRPTLDLADAWKAACLVAELQHRRFHDLRRYACDRMIRAGLAPTEAMALMGHKTLSMHLRYGTVDLPMLERAVAKVAALDGTKACDTDKSADKCEPALAR